MAESKVSNIFTALSAAQAEMGALTKGAVNPHFNKRYADLAAVVAAVREPFANHGICFFHWIAHENEQERMVTTIVHGETETRIECTVPIILAKRDMQGYKSATTYAKRVGLESLSGLAPEDDDGEGARSNVENNRQEPEPRTPEQIRDALLKAVAERPQSVDDVDKLANGKTFSPAFESLPPPMKGQIVKALTDKKAEFQPAGNADLGDELPEHLT